MYKQQRVQTAEKINRSYRCHLPELACEVTKSIIIAKVSCASLNLLLTFHLMWVSMAVARRPQQLWIDYFFRATGRKKLCDNL